MYHGFNDTPPPALPAPTPVPTPVPMLTPYDKLVLSIPAGTDPRVVYPELNSLLAMLSTMRPAWSEADEQFCRDYIEPLGAEKDAKGNYWVEILNPDNTRCPVLWSSHTDTVHSDSGTQRLCLTDQGVIMLASPATPEAGHKLPTCLGADCTTGVWLMQQMIQASVPGLYIFHRCEERGAVGSHWIATNLSDKIKHCKFAIAFDRKGYSDVITHQGFRTASTEFAAQLSQILEPLDYKPSENGIFTDTQSYAGIISECTNLSVGYHSAHSSREWQHYGFALMLRQVLVHPDFCVKLQKLESHRKPAERSYDYEGYGYGYGDQRNYYNRNYSNRSSYEPRVKPKGKVQGIGLGGDRSAYTARDWDDLFDEAEKKANKSKQSSAPDSFVSLCKDYPEEMYAFLTDNDFGSGELIEFLIEDGPQLIDDFLWTRGIDTGGFWKYFVDGSYYQKG